MSSAKFSTAQRASRKLFALATYAVSMICALCVPRRADRWIFGSWIGVGEGALAVARAVRQSDPNARISWAVANAAQAERARAEGFVPVRRTSWRGFWATLTARQIVITHGYRDVNRYGIAGAAITHLGHGVPLKRLHHHVARLTDGPGFAKSVLRRIYRVGAERVQLYVAGSAETAARLREANRVLPGRVRVLGDPRDDEVIRQAHDASRAQRARAEVRELLGLPPESHPSGSTDPVERLVLYAPTWRDGDPDPAVPDVSEITRIREWLAARGARLVIRSHPFGFGAYEALLASPEGEAARVHALPAALAPDITPLLGAFDVLVTDYSSIAVDFALLQRPILWFAPDLRSYSDRRGLYEPLETTAKGRVLASWAEVVTALEALADPAMTAAAAADSRELAVRFHAYPQGGAALRVVAEIQRLAAPATQRVPPGVFFESFEGRQISCNPLALDREIALRFPELPRYWSVAHERLHVPDGAVPLLIGSPDWFAARRHARVLIVNDWLRLGFRRRRGQTVLQTWHGTMLKHLALTRPHTGLQTRIAVRRESRRWSLLLSQNPHATAQFRRSYAYRGEILETGYPRDDRLAQAVHEAAGMPQRDPAAITAARRELGVPEGARVLVYAPTWRESRRGEASGLVDLLDVQALAAELDSPSDPWVVLARGHSRTLDHGSYDRGAERVIDVSQHPDVNDVILAADLFVTDYSSTMFDAAVAAVPLAFYVPDLAEYRDAERGFTFDFEASAPGPLLAERAELIEVARRGVPFSPAYARWRERFTPHDDGGAAARVVAELVERGAFGPYRPADEVF